MSLLLRALLMLAASSFAASSAANGLRLLSGEFDAKSKVERSKLAAEVLHEVDRLANLIQAPRPSEVAWVEAEQSQISKIKDVESSNVRAVQLHKAPEFQHRKVYEHLKELRSALLCVTEGPTALQREMFCWAVASYLLDETDVFGYGLAVLMSAKRLPDDLPKKLGVSAFEGVQLKSRWFARGIQQHITLRYLRGDIAQ